MMAVSRAALRRAQKIAQQYRYFVEPEGRRNCARPMEYSEVVGIGATPDEAVRQAVELATTGIAVLYESDRLPPTPTSPSTRRA